MNDAAEIAAFIRDILLICFALVGSVAFIVIAVVIVKSYRRMRDAVDRANAIMEKIEGFLKTLASLRQTLSSINSRSGDNRDPNVADGAKGNAIGAALGFLVRSIFARRSRDRGNTN